MPKSKVEAIIPPDFKSAAAQRAFEKQLKTISRDWQKELEKTTRTWNDKPTFKVTLKRMPKLYAVRAEVSDMRWIWIDEGTKDRPIVPKRPGGVLAFPSQFTPKTRKRYIGSRRGSSGPPMVFTRRVEHHKIEAREWTPMLSRRLTPRFMKTVDDAFKAYVKASGHGEQ